MRWTPCGATPWRGPTWASPCGMRPSWWRSGVPRRRRCSWTRRLPRAWAMCWARTSCRRAARSQCRPARSRLLAASVCPRRRAAAPTRSTSSSTAASCATASSPTPCARPTRTSCTAAASRPTSCSCRSRQSSSTSTCTRRRSKCAFVMAAPCTARCAMRSRTRSRLRARACLSRLKPSKPYQCRCHDKAHCSSSTTPAMTTPCAPKSPRRAGRALPAPNQRAAPAPPAWPPGLACSAAPQRRRPGPLPTSPPGPWAVRWRRSVASGCSPKTRRVWSSSICTRRTSASSTSASRPRRARASCRPSLCCCR